MRFSMEKGSKYYIHPRLISADNASIYLGISKSKFLSMVSNGHIPKPIKIDRRCLWDVRSLDSYVDEISDSNNEYVNTWD